MGVMLSALRPKFVVRGRDSNYKACVHVHYSFLNSRAS